MTSADFTGLRFSTDDFPEHERVEAWREILGRAVMKLEIDPLPGCSYQAAMTLHALPDLAIGAGAYSGMQFRRTPALIDSDDLFRRLYGASPSAMRRSLQEQGLQTNWSPRSGRPALARGK